MVSLGIFSVVPPTEPCALGSTQPLKVSTRDLSWGKGGRCVWLTTYHPCNAETSRKSGALIYPESLGPPRPVGGHLYFIIQCVPLATEPGWLADRCSVSQQLGALQTHSFSFLTQRTCSYSDFVAIFLLVLELLKKCRVR